jgi:HAD superfamily phosphatase (TIGR01668 family)
VGKFDQDKAGALRRYCPSRAAHRLQDVSLEELWQSGKRLILLDVDHTIVKWGEEEFSAEVLDWVASAKAMGFQLRILSNTRHPKRLARLSDKIDIPTKNGKFKPSPEMYMEALAETGFAPEQAVMIGDQIMTDILGANRSGIDSIWLQKMEGPEFAGTKINRVIERLVMSLLYRSTMSVESEVAGGRTTLLEKPIVRQFLKFLFVGAISFVIDTTIRVILMRFIHIDGKLASDQWGQGLRDAYPAVFNFATKPSQAFFPIACVIGSFVATFNSYIMNRALTFKIKDKVDAGKQLLRVFIVNYTGLAINVLVSSIFFRIIPGHPTQSAIVASMAGAGVAAIWNFVGQRYFAFRVHKRV